MIYTGSGSRETPPQIQSIMQDMAYYLVYQGWTLRSGKADGADMSFLKGVVRSVINKNYKGDIDKLSETYIPWVGFNKVNDIYDQWDIIPSDIGRCSEIAKQIHPAWDKCSRGAKLLHSRNVCQILGDTLDKPSKFVLYYAQEDSKGDVKGGTATAVNLARDYDIPTINMLHNNWKDKLKRLLENE